MPTIDGIIPAGSYTTQDVLNIMARYARKDQHEEKIVNLAYKITGKINNNDLRSKMIAIRNWILSHLRYVKDPKEAKRLFKIDSCHFENGDLEMVKSPLVVLETGVYDCDCAATLISSMLLALGIDARLVAVSFYSVNEELDPYGHVFAQGFDGYEWITIDPVSYPNEKRMVEKDAKLFKTLDV
jgi:transglutaminase-like putative cysteine protease